VKLEDAISAVVMILSARCKKTVCPIRTPARKITALNAESGKD